ncbi:hypothetical protein DAPPUDRAFT_117082 [Daphnia pulex]|uniref:Uncharacterized protein n=1 Tax=Daphnia pulex TaxID=6669 RepID=E9HRG7_DAPPU|nr:hypothetical protein DAPPUDRAFT_117082 [Daphnia pulex]|eukprot:EFX65664.1 hypothetical protein DAPPUDRAFT_117082 [Daphnia pulex]
MNGRKLSQPAIPHAPAIGFGDGIDKSRWAEDAEYSKLHPSCRPLTVKKKSLSQLTYRQSPKQSEKDENDFTLTCNAAFDCDLDELLALDRGSVLSKFKIHFSNAKEQAEVAYNDYYRLTDELTAIRAKLNAVKFALADKNVQLFKTSRSNQLVITGGLADPPYSSPPKSAAIPRAEPAKTVYTKSTAVDTKPTLIAWLNKVSLDKIESFMNLDPDGPTVQKFKKDEGSVTLTFKDVAETDKART